MMGRSRLLGQCVVPGDRERGSRGRGRGIILFVILVGVGLNAPGAQEPLPAITGSPPPLDEHLDEQSDDEWIFAGSGEPLRELVNRLTVTLSARMRAEYIENFLDYDDSFDDGADFVTNRYRLGLGVELSDHNHVYIEAQNNSTWGDNARFANVDLVDDDDFKVYQGYIQSHNLFGSCVSVKVGRQELVYGTQLILGNADFGPGLSHDAVKATIESGSLTVDAFYGKLVENDLFNRAVEDVNLAGIYGTISDDEGTTGLDFYWVNVNDRRPIEDKRHTIGGRVFAEAGPVRVNSELAWQFGQTDPREQSIRAFAWENNLILGLEDVDCSPEIELGYALGTGDGDPTDSRSETFLPLFQNPHHRFGLSDVVTTSNVHVVTAKTTAAVTDEARLGVAGYFYWAHRTDDVLSPGAFAPGAGTGGSKTIGEELNVFLDLELTRHVYAQLAWAHLFGGDYLRRRFGSRDDADRVYLHLVVEI